MGEFVGDQSKGKIDRKKENDNSPSSLSIHSEFLSPPPIRLPVWLVDSRLFSSAPQFEVFFCHCTGLHWLFSGVISFTCPFLPDGFHRAIQFFNSVVLLSLFPVRFDSCLAVAARPHRLILSHTVALEEQLERVGRALSRGEEGQEAGGVGRRGRGEELRKWATSAMKRISFTHCLDQFHTFIRDCYPEHSAHFVKEKES